MRIPYSWLREAVQAGAPGWDVSAEELEQAFIRIGHEVEDVIFAGPVTGPLTVGRVVEIEELTEFKKPIRACKVDVGENEPRDIVCGARNFTSGDLVVAALVIIPACFSYGLDVGAGPSLLFVTLPTILQESFDVHNIHANYDVAVLRCTDGELQLGYNFLDFSKDSTVPCGGRELEEACYNLQVTFPGTIGRNGAWR